MLCPNCLVQMHQFGTIGGGTAEEDFYDTWELKECPTCGRIYKEYYSAELVDDVEELLSKPAHPRSVGQAQALEKDEK